MNYGTPQAILDKICAYDRIVIFRHKRPDGDAVGATMGMARMLRLSFPDKDIRLDNADFADYTAFLGDPTDRPEDSFLEGALGIVMDTATPDRVSSPRYTLCKELVKLDHHINQEPFASTQWVEEERSSCCEMVAAFYHTFRDRLVLDTEAATLIYAGMVTDSGRFRFRSVSGETMRLAGMLLDLGIDTDTLYAHLYTKEYETLRFQSYVYRRMKRTPAGVAYFYVSRRTMRRFGITSEQASAAVSHLENIRGSLIWLAFIQGEQDIRVRLRSRFVTVSELANRYGGGGHACAAGATVHSRQEMARLVADADRLLADYKREHGGLL